MTGRGLVLVGSRGVGKSTVGRILAGRLGLEFVDTDTYIEATSGRRIADIFAEKGELVFRAEEIDALRFLTATRPGTILAPGGGAVLDPSNRDRLKRHGFVVWLTADPEVLARRLQADPEGLEHRPALTAAGTLGEIAEVLAVRTPLYRAIADATVDTTGRTAEQVADALLALWPGRGSVGGA